MTASRLSSLAVGLILAVALIAPSVSAQETPSPKDMEISQLWEDFLHYIMVARADLAQSFGQAILDSGAEPKELYLLSVSTAGSQLALTRGAKLPGMAKIVTRIGQMIEQGHKALRQDPKEIANSIELLGGTIRGYEMGVRRLVESGEYALPQLMQKLRDPATPVRLRENITEALSRLGKQAVRPLSVALQADAPELLEIIAGALARIEYPHAAARLKELSERKGLLPRTKKVVELALVACGGPAAMRKTVAALYYDQALNYYYQKASVAPDIRYPTANVWYWTDAGLSYRVVPREIFCDIYAMRMCRLALEHYENFYPAVSLWLAANLKRAADLPEGATDPTYGQDTPSANYFALASSAKFLQDVLARGLKDRNSAVATGAIEALARTAGAKNLLEPVAGGSQPLVTALGYSDRQVRFLAAVSLANALPEKRFNGYQAVLPQLIEALRQTGQKRALTIIADQKLRNAVKDAVRGAAYDVIDNPVSADAIAAAHMSPGVDVAVLASKPDPLGIIMTLRQDPTFATLPVVVVGPTESVRALARRDGRILQIAANADQEAIAKALADAGKLAAGAELTPEDAAAWTVRAANAIAYLGISGNRVFDITRSAGALTALMDDERDEVRLAASRALSVMPLAKAQRAIAAVAVQDDLLEEARLAAFDDLSASLRRFGNQLSDELAQEVLDIVVSDGSSELLNAAAEALGAMNLPSQKIKTLIIQTAN